MFKNSNPQFGGSLVGSMMAVGIALIAIVGLTTMLSKNAQQKRTSANRLNYAVFENTLRSKISKELTNYAFNQMSCDDIGNDLIVGGAPEFLRKDQSLTTTGITFQAIEDADFDYIDGTKLRRGKSIHETGRDRCTNTRIRGRQTRDNTGKPIVYRGNKMTYCLKLTLVNASAAAAEQSLWAIVDYQFKNLITNKNFDCKSFKTAVANSSKRQAMGGFLAYELYWTNAGGTLGDIHKGSMVSAVDSAGAPKLAQDECTWSNWFRREGSIDPSPNSCPEGEYIAAIDYKATSGGNDGVAKIQCCKFGGTFSITKGACQTTPTWYYSENGGGPLICDKGDYLAGFDYAASEATIYPPGGPEGKVMAVCCEAQNRATDQFKQKKCAWSPWFNSDILKNSPQTCPDGEYVAGLDYLRSTPATPLDMIGQMRQYCCDL